jgi:glutathione S-transferase
VKKFPLLCAKVGEVQRRKKERLIKSNNRKKCLLGEHLRKDYAREVNRFHKVPVIHDNDGFRLSESVAIFHYLGRKNIIPYPELKVIAKIDEFLSWNHNSLFVTTGKLFLETWVKPFRNIYLPPHGQMVNVSSPLDYVELDQSLNDLENLWLRDNKFLTGDKITFADLIAACEIMQILGMKLYELKEDKHARIITWLKNVREFFNPEFDYEHRIIYKFGEKFGGGPPMYLLFANSVLQRWNKLKKLMK